jgi:hypothetical protein
MIGRGGGTPTVSTPIDAVTVKGGVERVIDSATGDIARTTTGFIEDAKYGVYFILDTDSATAGFVSGVSGSVGNYIARVTSVGATSRGRLIYGLGSGTSASVAVSLLSKNAIKANPSTSYRITFRAKYTDLISNTANFNVQEYGADGSRLVTNLSTSSGTSDGFVNVALSFTTNASTAYLLLVCGISSAGDGQIIDWDVMGSTLEQVSTITNSGSSPAQFYHKVTAVSSTDNIDQSQVVSDNTIRIGETVSSKIAQQFLPTKKNLTGFVVRHGTETGTFTGDITFTIEATTSNAPSGTALSTVTIPNATWKGITADTDYVVTLPTPLTLTVDGSTKYFIVATSSTLDDSNYSRFRIGAGNLYTNGLCLVFNASWVGVTNDLYFKTLYSKNTTNFTVSTDTETATITAPTPDGWANGTVIDFSDYSQAVTLAPGANDVYFSSNGPDTADGTVDPSLQATVGGVYVG